MRPGARVEARVPDALHRVGLADIQRCDV
jgi:hypothetical protein